MPPHSPPYRHSLGQELVQEGSPLVTLESTPSTTAALCPAWLQTQRGLPAVSLPLVSMEELLGRVGLGATG